MTIDGPAAITKDDLAHVGDNEVTMEPDKAIAGQIPTGLPTPAGAFRPSISPAAKPPAPPITEQRRPWDLGDGVFAYVTIPVSLTKKNVERMKRYMNALAMEAAIAWDDEGEGEPADSE